MLAGAVVLAVFVPRGIANFSMFAALLLLSSFASAFKVSLPIASSGSTMSVSYAVDFAALLLVGAVETMLVAAASDGARKKTQAIITNKNVIPQAIGRGSANPVRSQTR